MNIAVFGASGFVGQNLVKYCIDTGIDIIASDIVEKHIDNVKFIKADLLNSKEVENVVSGTDKIIHLAAHPLPASIDNPKLNMRINIEGSLNIMDAAIKNNIDHILFSSASSLYGDIDGCISESQRAIPKTPYAVAKFAIENYLRVYQELYGLNYTVFRFFNVYGPLQYPESRALIPNVIKRIMNNEKVDIFGDGSSTRDFIFVDDVAKFFLSSAQNNIKNCVVNLGTGKPTSIKQIVDLCSKLIEKEAIIDYKPGRQGEIKNFYADTTKLSKLFNSIPETDIKTGLKNTIKWFMSL